MMHSTKEVTDMGMDHGEAVASSAQFIQRLSVFPACKIGQFVVRLASARRLALIHAAVSFASFFLTLPAG